mgnify:FL=1
MDVSKDNKILLSYSSDEEYGNFGDLLSRWIVEKLSGKEVVKYKYELVMPHFCAIGSILSRNEICSSVVVWGSGFISPQNKWKIRLTAIRQFFRGRYGHAKILAVRGKKTRNILINAGFECPEVYGDPALLMPTLYTPKKGESKYRVGIICHYVHEELPGFLNNKLDGVKKIHIYRSYDKITDFIDEVCSCDVIISSSLHGLIIANAYGIPAVRMIVKGYSVHPNKSKEYRQDFKYEDYLSGFNALAVDKQGTEYKLNSIILKEDEVLTEELVSKIYTNATRPEFKWSTKLLLDTFPYTKTNV